MMLLTHFLELSSYHMHMALEIAAVQREIPIDFAKAYEERMGEVPLSVIRRETLIVPGRMPLASDCRIFLSYGERRGENEWRKVIYRPVSGVGEDGFSRFAQGYLFVVTPQRIVRGRKLPKEYYVEGDMVTDQGRPYIKASFSENRKMTRIELGYRREEPAFEVLDGTEKYVTFRTRRAFWQKKGLT